MSSGRNVTISRLDYALVLGLSISAVSHGALDVMGWITGGYAHPGLLRLLAAGAVGLVGLGATLWLFAGCVSQIAKWILARAEGR